MVDKKILGLAIFLIFLTANVFADSISNYYVKENVPLDKVLTVTGQFNADTNASVLCKFLVLEADGNVLLRLTDEYTFADGTFYTEYLVNSPEFVRGQDYNVTTTCGSVSATAVFSVVNKEALIDHVTFELLWFKENAFTIVVLLLSVFLLMILIATVVSNT